MQGADLTHSVNEAAKLSLSTHVHLALPFVSTLIASDQPTGITPSLPSNQGEQLGVSLFFTLSSGEQTCSFVQG